MYCLLGRKIQHKGDVFLKGTWRTLVSPGDKISRSTSWCTFLPSAALLSYLATSSHFHFSPWTVIGSKQLTLKKNHLIYSQMKKSEICGRLRDKLKGTQVAAGPGLKLGSVSHWWYQSLEQASKYETGSDVKRLHKASPVPFPGTLR